MMRAPSFPLFAALAILLAPSLLSSAPHSAFAGPGDARVPEVIDLPVDAAEAELRAGGFGAERRDAQPDAGPLGTIAHQEPGGFAFAPPGTKVAIYVRGGVALSQARGGHSDPMPPAPSGVPVEPILPSPPGGRPAVAEATVPNVRGKTEDEAIDLLKQWKITILTVDSVPENEGRVTYQKPAAGSSLGPEGVVEISVGRSGTPAPAGTSLVPRVIGLTQDAATQKLTAARLVPMFEPTVSADPTKAGKVISQDPAAGTVVANDSNVVVTVGRVAASPINEAEVPDCSKLAEGVARKRLSDAGFALVTVKDRLASAADAGLVLEQDPAPMTRLLKGRNVTLTVGRLLMLPVAVPNVLNVDWAPAEKALRDAGFEVERVFADTLQSDVGKVIAEEPPGGSGKVRGSFVKITIGRSNAMATPTISVPSVVGRIESQVRPDLRARGFGVRVNLVPGAPSDAGKIRSQSPEGGSLVAPGTEIALDVVRADATQPGVPLPNYLNMDAATAQADLQAKGLRVAIAYTTGSPEGRVISQQPVGGSVTVRGALVTLTVATAPTLGIPTLLEPVEPALPRNHGVVFRWNPVVDAEDYQIEVLSWRDGSWQRENQYELRELFMKVGKTQLGLYQWHVRARRAGGTVSGPWSELRQLRVY